VSSLRARDETVTRQRGIFASVTAVTAGGFSAYRTRPVTIILQWPLFSRAAILKGTSMLHSTLAVMSLAHAMSGVGGIIDAIHVSFVHILSGVGGIID